MGRREEKREATRQEILTAASELFRTKGYDATSVDDIVLAANVAKGTFYYHFEAKEDLVLALQEAELKRAAEHSRAKLASGESPMKVLFEFVSDASHWTEANSDLARALFKQKFTMMARHHGEGGSKECPMQAGPPPSIKIYFFDFIVDILSAAQKRNEIRDDIATQDLARIVIAVVMSARMSFLLGGTQDTMAETVQRSLNIVLDGMKPQA